MVYIGPLEEKTDFIWGLCKLQADTRHLGNRALRLKPFLLA